MEGTLNAAMLDAGAADAVRTGMLVTTLSATGVDEQTWAVGSRRARGARHPDRALRQPAPGPALHVVPENKRLLRETAEEKLAEAEAEVKAATKAAAKAEKAVADLQGKRFQLRSEIDELQRRIDALEDRIEGLDEDIEVAEQDHEDAVEAVGEAETAPRRRPEGPRQARLIRRPVRNVAPRDLDRSRMEGALSTFVTGRRVYAVRL